MIYLEYGDYTHSLGEAAVTIASEALRDGMGEVYGHQVTWTIDGMLSVQTDQDDLLAALEELEEAYSSENQDVKLVTADGTVAHSLLTADCLGGTKIITPPSFPQGKGAELGTFRNYRIVITGEKILDPSDLTILLSFEETVEAAGGGPVYGHIETLSGRPVKQLLRRQSLYRATQVGRAVGLRAYPTAPAAIWPAALVQLGSSVKRSPRRVSTGNYKGYEVSWQYQFESATQLNGNPRTWNI